MDTEYIEAVLDHYIVTALWSSMDESDDNGGSPMDENYGPEDIASDTLDTMRREVTDFLELIERDRPGVFDVMADTVWHDPHQVGHDFWLTRNRHGAGFWDRYYGDPGPGSATELGDYLTKWAKSYGSVDLYIGDDGAVHQM